MLPSSFVVPEVIAANKEDRPPDAHACYALISMCYSPCTLCTHLVSKRPAIIQFCRHGTCNVELETRV